MRDRGGAANCAFWTFQFDTYLQLVTDASAIHSQLVVERSEDTTQQVFNVKRGSGHMEREPPRTYEQAAFLHSCFYLPKSKPM